MVIKHDYHVPVWQVEAAILLIIATGIIIICTVG
jgi:hypothetical protein